MGIVDFNTQTWKDSWFRKLSTKAKNLFIFLWTNDHKNLACIYEIDIETICFYTGLTKKDVKDTLSILYPKVKYDFENEVVWVVNFVRHQFMRTENISPKIITGIKNNLVQNNGHFFIGEFLKEYQSLDISYEHPINTVSEGYQYPPGEGVGEGKGKKIKKVEKKFIPPSLNEVKAFFKEKGYRLNIAQIAFDHYNLADWHDTEGKPVKNWKQKMNTVWFKDENKAPPIEQSNKIECSGPCQNSVKKQGDYCPDCHKVLDEHGCKTMDEYMNKYGNRKSKMIEKIAGIGQKV